MIVIIITGFFFSTNGQRANQSITFKYFLVHFFLHIILGFNQFVHLLSVMLSNRREVCWNDKNYFIDIVDRMRHGGWGRFFCCLDRKEKTIQKCNLCMYNFSLFVKVIRKQKILSLSAHSCFFIFFKCWLNSYLGKWFL